MFNLEKYNQHKFVLNTLFAFNFGTREQKTKARQFKDCITIEFFAHNKCPHNEIKEKYNEISNPNNINKNINNQK